MADESNSYRDVLSRRRFVELAGVSGAAALAGCDGSDTGTENEDEETTSGDDEMTEAEDDGMDVVDQRHNGGTTVAPSETQFNPFNSTGQAAISHHLLFEKWAQFYYSDGSYHSAAIDDWEFTGDTFEMSLRDDLTWSDGEPVTSEDLAIQLELIKKSGGAIFDFAEEIQTPDDTTIVLTIPDDVNPALIEFAVFERWARIPRQKYSDLNDEVSEDDLSAVTGFADEDPITNGPFQFEEKDDQLMLTSRFEDSPYSDNVNFSEYGFNFLGGGNQARQQALLSLDIDSEFSLFVPARIVADFPDAIEEVKIPAKFGLGIACNFNREHAEDRSVRQAIAHVINREQVVQNAAPRAKVAPEIPTGIASADQDRWLGDVKDQFDTYGVGETQAEKATELLEADGYEKVDGTWQDSDGNVVTVPITCPNGWSDWVLGVETAVDQLNSFGFDASLKGTGDYWPTKNAGDFKFLANTWLAGAPTGAYPYFSLRHQLHEPMLHKARTYYPGHMDNEQFKGQDASITVPARDGSGDMELHPGDELETLASTADEDTISEKTIDLAYVANQDLPWIPLAEKQEQQWLTGDDWSVPENANEDPDANVKWASTWLPRMGKMNYQG